MITIHYHADRKALIDAAESQEAQDAIRENYDSYVEYLASNGAIIDYDSHQTTYCWSGVDEWPADLQDFWTWLN